MLTPISAPHRHLGARAGGALVALLVMLTLAAGGPASAAPQARVRTASTGSLVYLKWDGVSGFNIWIARTDGTGARQVTSGSDWFLPSESDGGTIVGRTPGRTAPDGSQGYDLAVMDQFGHVANRVPTPSDFSSNNIPAFPPDQARISPDGTKIAYDNWIDGEQATYWTPSNATTLDWPSQTLGQEDNIQPAWMDNSHLMLMETSALNCDADFPVKLARTYHVGDGDNTSANWFDEPTNQLCGGFATGFTEAISLAHKKLAIIEDDRLNWFDLVPRTVKLRLFTLNAQNPTTVAPTLACQVSLPAAKFANVAPNTSSPTFSPDGNALAWGNDDGIHVTNVSNLSDCSSVTSSVLIANGAEPYFSPAPLRLPVTISGAGVQSPFRASTSIPVSWSGDGGPYDIADRSASWSGGGFGSLTMLRSNTTATSATLTGTPGRTYCFSGRDTGTTSFGAQRCTAVALDDRSLSGSWSRRTGSGFYLGTYSLATQKGLTLTRTGAHAKQVAVLAVACPTCGSIAMLWAGSTIRTVNLQSSTRKIVFFSVKFTSVRTGTFQIKVTSSGKPVEIDGAAFSQV